MKHPQFAQRFREACADAKAPDTQEALGKFLGVSGTMAWNYRNGEKLPRMAQAIAIANKLDVCVEWLLTGRGPKHAGDIGKEAADSMLDISELSPDAQAVIRAVVRSFTKSEGDPVDGRKGGVR